jgi:MFS family permease
LQETGTLQGLVLGAAAGAAYALATPQPPGGGMAAPTGRRRLAVMASVGVGCALGAILLAWLGHPLVGGLVHDIARSSRSEQLVLAPLGHIVGEPGFGPLTQVLLGAFEGCAFGATLAWGLTRRPRPRVARFD